MTGQRHGSTETGAGRPSWVEGGVASGGAEHRILIQDRLKGRLEEVLLKEEPGH